jgi:hypothetical protein
MVGSEKGCVTSAESHSCSIVISVVDVVVVVVVVKREKIRDTSST